MIFLLTKVESGCFHDQMLFKMEESGYATLKTFYMQQGSID
jgi:hypothetical protein